MNKKKLFLMLLVLFTGLMTVLFESQIRRKYDRSLRAKLYHEIKPVSIENCNFKRFGGVADGGYLLCENLLNEIQSVYSYGIAGEDDWGCEITTKYNLPIHQYDCFDKRKPNCNQKENFHFNEECVSHKERLVEERIYNTFQNQIQKNSDTNKKLLVKMDIEGDEWESLAATSDEILQNIDQLAIEFHNVNTNPLAELLLMKRLKKFFYIVNIHFNNYSCQYDFYPLPSSVFQALLVNKRLGVIQTETKPETYLNPLDKPDNPNIPDCQAKWN